MASHSQDIIDYLDTPILLVQSGQVKVANQAAKALLGRHIAKADVRLALRNPDVIALISSDQGGEIVVGGLSLKDSQWAVRSKVLDPDTRLITLMDVSADLSVARAHTDFVANASHELRTPLAAILGYAETLADPKAGDDQALRGRFLGIIAREASRMQALVEDLMSLSRIEARKHDAPRAQINIVKIANEAVAEFAHDPRATFSTEIDSADIQGDRPQILQVLRNLIDNAAKYGAPKGLIEVKVSRMGEDWVMITVQNEGPPIKPEDLPRVTERFYRANAGESRAAGGTGLGLAIVKHIVERHRGRLEISSSAEKGTSVSITLPTSARS